MNVHRIHSLNVCHSRSASSCTTHAVRSPHSNRPRVPAPSPQPSTDADEPTQLHGESPRRDPFRWLQAGPRNPTVLRYLQQEHEYSKQQLQHLLPLRKKLEQEIAERVWRLALMTAAQQPSAEPPSPAADTYGAYEYRREPVLNASPGLFRHLRVPQAALSPAGLARSSAEHGHHDRQQQRQQPAAAPGGAAAAMRAAELTTSSPDGRNDAAAAARCLLDESQRAAECGSAASYALHSFAPSPAFDMVAFSEATQPVPAGVRMPDRYVLHVVHADTGRPMLEAVPDVSGDLGWVRVPGRRCGSAVVEEGDGGGDDARGGGATARLYFTRKAQRELWYVDVCASSSCAPYAGGGPASVAAAAAFIANTPALAFPDPDGQPIQLVRYGASLYAETLGNTGVPLEIRLLGQAAEHAPTGQSNFACEPPPAGPGRVVAGGQPTLDPSGSDAADAAAAGTPLLSRKPGRQYSAMHVELGRCSTGPPPPPAAPAPANPDRDSDDSGAAGLEAAEALVLWLQDLQHPNGCLLLAWVAAPPARPDPTPRAWPLLELLPHDPALRLHHVQVRPDGRVLCLRVAVDDRGDPMGRYDLAELQLELDAVRRVAAAAGTVPDVSCAAPGCDPTASRQLSSGGVHAEDACPYTRPAEPLLTLRRRRTVDVQGAPQHALQVVAWDPHGGMVTLSCSTMVSEPTVSTVSLVPPSADSAAAGSIALVRCDRADPRVVVERLWATSHDGALVPITLCRMVSESLGGSSPPPQQRSPAPVLLRVYGAYGRDPPLDYQPALQPLLRRGVAVAVAHVRGGGQLGPAWYEGGRGGGGRKANSHLDLLAAARQLVTEGVTQPGLMCVETQSAGGWSAGPALSAAAATAGATWGAALWRAAVLTVPSLDLLTALLEDPTYGPYEVGDPRGDAALYRQLRAWSPYDRLATATPADLAHFPEALLLRIALFDTNVPYWDPAKYMARLRSVTAGDGRGGGMRVMQVKPGDHESYDTVADDATFCAFVLWALGVWSGGTD